MSRKKIKRKNIIDRFKCVQCEHKWSTTRPPGPYYGLGWDKNGNPTDIEEDWAERKPAVPPKGDCPKCGSLYYKWLNYIPLTNVPNRL